MKSLYEEIVVVVKELKANSCLDTHKKLEMLLNRTIPSDGSEDVIKYQMIKQLLKSKAIMLNNVANNDSIKYLFLWTTTDMIVRHFDLQNYIELSFTQSNPYVNGDYIRGEYTVSAKLATSIRQSDNPEPESQKIHHGNHRNHHIRKSPNMQTNFRDAKARSAPVNDDFITVVSRKNPNRHNSTPGIRRGKDREMIQKDTHINTPINTHTNTEKDIKEPPQQSEQKMRHSIDWSAQPSTKNWADSDSE